MPEVSDAAIVPSFVVIVGIDGSGKSTLLERLKFPTLVATDWRELRNYELPQMLVPDSPTQIKSRLPSLSRGMFIGGHLVAQYEYLVRPRLEAGHSVALDSYYYKLLVKERLLGRLHPALERLAEELPQPDVVVMIDIPPNVSFARRSGSVSPYEYYSDGSRSDYIHFQTDLRDALLEIVGSLPSGIIIDGDCSPEELLESVGRELLAALAARSSDRIGRREIPEVLPADRPDMGTSAPARVIHRSVMPFGRWISVESQTIQLEHGDEMSVHVVDFPEIALVVARTETSVVLVRQLRFPVRDWILEAPAGRIDPGEVPIETAIRELREETGYAADSIRMVGQIRIAPHLSNEVTHVFEASGLRAGLAEPQKGEFVSSVDVPIGELRGLIQSHQLIDAKTVAALVLTGLL